MSRLRIPCANCPWRVDAPRKHWDPTHFVDIWRNCQDDGVHVMGCHKSTVQRPRVCQGWVRVMGLDAIGVRLELITGQVTETEIAHRGGPELFKSFAAMLRANGIPRLPRNRWVR